jgi:hypothetical protein
MLTKEDFNDKLKDDRFIYHYTSYSCAIENILKDKKLLFNRVNNTNDPLEFENILHHASYSGNIDIDEKIKLLQIGDDSNDIVKNKFKICCFCMDKEADISTDDNPYINKGVYRLRTWSQYGDGHKGVCLVFNKDKLIKIIKNKFDDVFEKEISYKYFFADLSDITNIKYERDRNEIPLERVKKYIYEYLFQKHIDYESEQEYRIAIYQDNDCDNILIDFEDSLEGIIVGVGFPKDYETRIKNSTKLPVFKMKWLNGYPFILGIDDGFPEW